ncbi:hypothetical protein SE1039_23510 [Staphylococcus equorum]|nr:hypothetical protein SE1039_23510 [Staphylococcus equorum]
MNTVHDTMDALQSTDHLMIDYHCFLIEHLNNLQSYYQ